LQNFRISSVNQGQQKAPLAVKCGQGEKQVLSTWWIALTRIYQQAEKFQRSNDFWYNSVKGS
jgi:hypothetical protein